LVLYSFYKNVLYVVTQFYFGFYSGFSGQTLYEKYIYQLYNITMTSLPIMWYCMADFEYQKDKPEDGKANSDSFYFMRNPYLYKIGINKECFSLQLMLRWIIYALFHALLIYYFCFQAITGAPQSDGKDSGFWLAGHVVYGACCILANVILVHKFNIIDHIGTFTVALMIFAYFFFLGIQSVSGYFPEVSHIFATTFEIFIVWAGLLLAIGTSSAIEFGYRYWNEIIMSDLNRIHDDSSEGEMQPLVRKDFNSIEDGFVTRNPQTYGRKSIIN